MLRKAILAALVSAHAFSALSQDEIRTVVIENPQVEGHLFRANTLPDAVCERLGFGTAIRHETKTSRSKYFSPMLEHVEDIGWILSVFNTQYISAIECYRLDYSTD